MIVKKDLGSMTDGQEFESIVYMKTYSKKPTKNGSMYIDGLVEMKGSVPFKIWSGDLFNEMDKYDYQGLVCRVQAKVNEYNGTKSLILKSVKAIDEGVYDPADFFEDKYDANAYWNALETLVVKNCSAEAVEIFKSVMSDIKERFLVEFAARGHHDAVKSGLLAHTFRVTNIVCRVMKLYPTIVNVCSMDTLVLGSALHDIGKVYEYTNGSIQGNGLIVSHNTFGVEILMGHKEEIIDKKDEEFYYSLLAIIQQHHGEFGERPRVVEAYIIHMADNLEASLQAVSESFELQGTDFVTVDGLKLYK